MKKKASTGIYKISAGIYQISWYEKGSRKWETIHTSLLKEARDVRNQRIIDVKRVKEVSLDVINRDASLDAIWGAIEGHCRAIGNTRKTIGEYKRRFWRLFKEFPEARGVSIKRPTELTDVYLNQYLGWYVNDYGARQNPASEARTIKIIMGKLKRLGYIDKDLYEILRKFVQIHPNEDERYPNLSNTELIKLFDYMAKDAPSYHDFFMFLLLTGRRPMEVAQILKESVEWGGLNDPLRINISGRTAKNRKKDQIGLHTEKDVDLKRVIVNSVNRSNLLKSLFLFCNKSGRAISSTNQEVYIKKVSKEVLGVVLSAKYFRKRYGTLCGLNGVPMKDAMSRSGHRDVGIFVKHYQRPTQDGISAVINAIGLQKG